MDLAAIARLRKMRESAHRNQAIWLDRAQDHHSDYVRKGAGSASVLDIEGMTLCIRRAAECGERAATIAECATAMGMTQDQIGYAESDLTCECGRYHPSFDDARDCCLGEPS